MKIFVTSIFLALAALSNVEFAHAGEKRYFNLKEIKITSRNPNVFDLGKLKTTVHENSPQNTFSIENFKVVNAISDDQDFELTYEIRSGDSLVMKAADKLSTSIEKNPLIQGLKECSNMPEALPIEENGYDFNSCEIDENLLDGQKVGEMRVNMQVLKKPTKEILMDMEVKGVISEQD
ncbi:uncharacterized protein [Prorops nasuta]|uniref:uncharacterized protein n=1 Tax=Prorops nasuta TaxID=863751 RepID=UPI0034CF97C1